MKRVITITLILFATSLPATYGQTVKDLVRQPWGWYGLKDIRFMDYGNLVSGIGETWLANIVTFEKDGVYRIVGYNALYEIWEEGTGLWREDKFEDRPWPVIRLISTEGSYEWEWICHIFWLNSDEPKEMFVIHWNPERRWSLHTAVLRPWNEPIPETSERPDREDDE